MDKKRRRIHVGAGGRLPRWVTDEINLSTPKPRRQAAIRELELGLRQFADDRLDAAYRTLTKAKKLAPQAPTIRELLGLAAYNTERWQEALRELRTYRRMTGDTTHMAVEMDCLRAMGREADVEKTWNLFRELGGSREADDEARVVYGSYLADKGRLAEAWAVVKPGRLVAHPPESTLRRWAVAARVAAESGRGDAARRILDAIRSGGDQPWLADLEALVDRYVS
jgi:lipopolysaccharide biosynthesis regulator YciM